MGFGVFLGLMLITYLNLPERQIFALAVVVGCFFPDLDIASSWFGRQLPFGSWFTQKLLGHRQFLHSLWVPLTALLVLDYLNFAILGYGFFGGYLAHLFLDSLTKKGAPWLWPWLRIKGPIKSGGFEDKVLFIAFIVGAVVLLVF